MFLTATPLLIAAAAVASPDFQWLDTRSVPIDNRTLEVFAVDSGEVLIVTDDHALFGHIGGELRDVRWQIPVPDPSMMPPGLVPTEPFAVGLTEGGALLVRWDLTEPIRMGDAVDDHACSIFAPDAVWMAWDPVREVSPVVFEAPDGGTIVDVFGVNERFEAVGMVTDADGVRGASWTDAGSLTVMPDGAFAHSVCNGGWHYGEDIDPLFGTIAAVWSPDGARTTIGVLPGHGLSAATCGGMGTAYGLSEAFTIDLERPVPMPDALFVWSPGTPIEPFAADMQLDFASALADLPPTSDGRFTTMQVPRDTPGPTAFLVDPLRGMIDLNDLVPASIDLDGFNRFLGVTTIDSALNSGTDIVVGIAERVLNGERVQRVFTLRVDLSPADVAMPYRTLDLSDIDAFIDAFVKGYGPGDMNLDGQFDMTDIDLFIEAWLREG